jgi:hypothetical protein
MSTLIRSLAVAGLLLASRQFVTSSATDVCTSADQPNPIAALYPDLISGTLNGTTMIIPIDLTLAQSLVPEHAILESSYRSLLPSFPKGMYPLMVSAKHDHDVQLAAYNLSMADFTVSFRFCFGKPHHANFKQFQKFANCPPFSARRLSSHSWI